MDVEKPKDPKVAVIKKKGVFSKVATIYYFGLRSFLAQLEHGYENLGRYISSYPKTTILISLSMVMLCSAGFSRFNVEKRTEKLYVPQNSIAEQALDIGKDFYKNRLNTRSEELLFLPKDNGNILRQVTLLEASAFVTSIQNMSDYGTLCRPIPKFLKQVTARFNPNGRCNQLNFFEVFTTKNYSKEIIFQNLTAGLTDPTLLMSNGRSVRVNIGESLAKFQINFTESEVFASALRIVLYMKEDSIDNSEVMEWEKRYIKTIESLKNSLKHIEVFYSSERSMQDAISDSSSSDIGLISITFTVMLTFACLTLVKFVNPVRGHNWLALTGVFATALGILAGIGITMAVGVPFVSLVGVVPFLVVSIGIDDMFILVDEFDRQPKNMHPKSRVTNTLARVGATVTMTTITNVVAFFISATSAFPAVRYFCIFTSFCISFAFLLQITFFVALLTYDAKRISQNRSDCCPMIKVADQSCFDMDNQFSLSHEILKTYARVLLKVPVKMLVIIITIGMFVGGVFGCMNIDTKFSRQSLALPESHFSKYVNTFENVFPQTLTVSIQLTSQVNYSDPAIRNEISRTIKIAYKTGFYERRNLSWLQSFEDFTKTRNISVDGVYFTNALNRFLEHPVYKQYKLDVIRNAENNIVASRVLVYYKDISDSEFQKDAMVQLRNDLKKLSKLDFTVAADSFIFFEQFAIVTSEVVSNLLWVSLVIVVVLIPFCIHPLIILIIIFEFALMVMSLFGLMYLWDVQLNSISMINMVMSIGFSVDYSTHIAHAFVTSQEPTVHKRIVEAVSTLGGSVLLGGVSTFLGMSLTGFASSPIFQIFFKMFIGIIAFGLYNGLVLLPVLLSIFTPFLNQNQFKLTKEDLDFFKFKTKQKLKSIMSQSESQQLVSIMGMSTLLPFAKTKNDFWKLLKNGQNTVTSYPENRYGRGKHFEVKFNSERSVPGKVYVSDGSYLENIDYFDHTFFGITAAEAKVMDPQQRLLLQGTYEAIEDAGMTLDELQKCTTGVYIGVMNEDYSKIVLEDSSHHLMNQFVSTGVERSILANRISFIFNFSGPSLSVDTACSSSMTALSIACDHLQKGIIDVAIIGAANLVLCPKHQATICAVNMLALDGKCKVFDERADGYGRGEAVIVFVLKRRDYVDPSDRPYCDVISWGINNDGQTAAPITAPSVEGQKRLMKVVLQNSGVNPKDVQYVEMHGTGTVIGDSVEVKSVDDIYGQPRETCNPIVVGSVKSNINHTESAAGLAGLAKVCLMMTHKEFVQTTGIKNTSARLGLDQTNLHVQKSNIPWPANKNEMPRLASINSFGFGGSNGHVILREHITVFKRCDGNIQSNLSMMLIPLTARSYKSLYEMAGKYGLWLQSLEENEKNRRDLCYTLSARKTLHNIRMIVGAPSLNIASNVLTDVSIEPELKSIDVCIGKTNQLSSKVAFVFGGQGSHWLGMAGDLINNEFIRESLNNVHRIAAKFGKKHNISVKENLVSVQISIFALQYAVAKFLMYGGIIPTFVSGHSLGDVTAACVANIIDLKSAVKIIAIRAHLQDKLNTVGAMAAIGLCEEDVISMFKSLGVERKLCIAAENDKKSVTISGDVDGIDRVKSFIEQENSEIFFRKLDTEKAFHSHHMEAMNDKFMKKIERENIKVQSAQIRFFSTTEGREMDGHEITDSFWWKNLRSRVLFHQAIKKMYTSGACTFIEISPRPVISHYLNQIAKQMEIDEVNILQALPARKENERLKYLNIQCIGKMYTLGYPINFGMFQDLSGAEMLSVPSYPWQESAMWATDEPYIVKKTLPLLGSPSIVNEREMTWTNEINLYNFMFVKDHSLKTFGIVLPGACYVEMAFNAALLETKLATVILKHVTFDNLMALDEKSTRQIHCTKKRSKKLEKFTVKMINEYSEIILSTSILECFNNSTERYSMKMSEALIPPPMRVEVEKAIEMVYQGDKIILEGTNQNDISMLKFAGLNNQDRLSGQQLEEFITSTEVVFGEKFRLLNTVWSNDNNVLVRFSIPGWLENEMPEYVIHPCLIDACIQCYLFLDMKGKGKQFLPTGVDLIRLNPIEYHFRNLYCVAQLDQKKNFKAKLMDGMGNVLMLLQGLQVSTYTQQQRTNIENSLYHFDWKVCKQVPDTFILNDQTFVIFAASESAWMSSMFEALADLQVEKRKIHAVGMNKTDTIELYSEHAFKLLDHLSKRDGDIVVVNLLPLEAGCIPLKAEMSFMPEWLCFDSTLNILKIATKNNKTHCKMLLFTHQNAGYELVGRKNASAPWSSMAWGAARTLNLESEIPCICVDVEYEASKEVCLKALSSMAINSSEEGVVILNNTILQPSLERLPMKNEETEPAECLEENKDFYLSWSTSQQQFFAKGFSTLPQLPDSHIEVKVLYATSGHGEYKELLKNIKDYNSRPMLQIIYGNVTNVGSREYNVGDCVLGFVKSKWVRNKLQLPLNCVFKAPAKLIARDCVLYPGCMSFAHLVLSKLFKVKDTIRSMLVVVTSSNQGVTHCIINLARKRGIAVTTSEDMNLNAGKGPRPMSPLLHMRDNENYKDSVYDCILCPPQLHPLDNTMLEKELVEDGILGVLNNYENGGRSKFNFSKQVTIVNFQSIISLSAEEVSTIFNECKNEMESISSIRCQSVVVDVVDVCKSTFDENYSGNKDFGCVAFEQANKEVHIGQPSLDYQGLKDDCTYVVVGGSKGIGLDTVKWMASRGAGTILTLSRSNVTKKSMLEFESLEQRHQTKIKHLELDISTSEGVHSLEKELNYLPKVAGVINSAGVLDDKYFMDVDENSYRKVMAPKVNGTLLLHEMLERRNETLDFFVLYSSITSMLGNQGQTSYGAANSFMNGFAWYSIKHLNKPCLSVCWGAMGGAGMLNDNERLVAMLQSSGLRLLDIKTGLQWMETVLTMYPEQGNVLICDVDLATYLKRLPARKSNGVLLESLRRELPETNEDGGFELLNSITKAKSEDAKLRIVLKHLVKWLANWMAGVEEEIDCNVPFFSYGIDSIGASELKFHIKEKLKVDFEVFFFMQPETTATSLAVALAKAINQNCKNDVAPKRSSDIARNDFEEIDFVDHNLQLKGPFRSSIRVSPVEDVLKLPNDYLSCIYNPADAKAKLFMVHPSHRYVGVFHGMAAGMKYQNLFSLYVFGSPDPGYMGEDILSVTRLAKACIKLLLKVQPFGPYFLGGYSFGGVVAVEMAAILQSMGKITVFLCMIDTLQWFPEAKSNCHFIKNSIDLNIIHDRNIKDQVLRFLSRIALSQLKMTVEEFDRKSEDMAIEDVAGFLNERANDLSVTIPDALGVYQSIMNDYSSVHKYHNEWIPPINMYEGNVLYIKAETCLCTGVPFECDCKKVVGNAVQCWTRAFQRQLITITCPGDHYTLMELHRAHNVGKIIAVSASLQYRQIFPMIGCISLNTNHTTTLGSLKERTMKICCMWKSGFKRRTLVGFLKLNKSESKVKVSTNLSQKAQLKINFDDVVNVKTQDVNSLSGYKLKEKHAGMFSGYSIVKNDLRNIIMMAYSRQDFQRLTFLFEAVFKIELPS